MVNIVNLISHTSSVMKAAELPITGLALSSRNGLIVELFYSNFLFVPKAITSLFLHASIPPSLKMDPWFSFLVFKDGNFLIITNSKDHQAIPVS